jgi:hypothetical protein
VLNRTPLVSRQGVEEGEELKRKAEEEDEVIHAKTRTAEPREVTEDVEGSIRGLSGGGRLPNSVRSFMEPRFSHDFGEVRVHTDGKAAKLARAVNAQAFTVGSKNIVFDPELYRPETASGKQLLAHELTHVVQQGGGRPLGESADSAHGAQPADGPVLNRVGAPPANHLQQQPVSEEEFQLAEQQRDYYRLIDNWYSRYLSNLETNARNARNASERFIGFEEGGISQLRTTGNLGTGVAYLFGTPGAVVALCIMVLTEVAAQGLSGASAKKAAASKKVEENLARAKKELDSQKSSLDNRVAGTSSLSWNEWRPLYNTVANLGVPQDAPENIIYRDLLLALAKGGGYNITGSQWNVDNMSLFGKAPWYHSWDWGSPGWTNGQDIADELNALAAGDPSTRKNVRINP